MYCSWKVPLIENSMMSFQASVVQKVVVVMTTCWYYSLVLVRYSSVGGYTFYVQVK